MTALSIVDIMKALPHRYPFLMVDRIEECDVENKRIVGIKNVAANEPCFQGHFPGLPVMPGVLQLEAMAQTAGVLLDQISDDKDMLPFFLSIDRAKFRKVVTPGDQLRIEVEVTKLRGRTVKFQARALVDGSVVSEAEMMCMLTDRNSQA